MYLHFEKLLIMSEIKIIRGDITALSVDAIVNAANSSLLGGGGVDGAIHRAAGPQLLKECKTLGGCRTGDAKITKGYLLPARFVIHTVGPVWHGGDHEEYKLLAGCYRSSLQLAVDHRLRSVAFPAVSTGVYGYPFDLASRIAITTVRDFLENNHTLKEIIFVLFSKSDYELFKTIYATFEE